MDEDIKKALDTKGEFHRKLLSHCTRLVDLSRAHMNRFYEQWDANDKTIRGDRLADTSDVKAAQRGEPVKLTLPFTYAQVQTFIAFMMSLFNQRSSFYEIEDAGDDNTITPERDAEICLNRDLRRSQFSKAQYQFYLDLCRSSFCVAKHLWEEETMEGLVAPTEPPAPEQPTLFGGTVPELNVPETGTVFLRQGNKVLSVSPYHFFPDVRLPLSRVQDGEFCASEDEFSIVRLKQMQKNGAVTNVEEIQPLGQDAMENRRLNYLNASNVDNFKTASGEGQKKGGGMCVVTEVQVWITPKDFTSEGKHPLGDEDDPTLFVVWYANDKTILKAEPMNYTHNKFTYDVGEYSADQMRVINESLAEVLSPLQDHATWFMNSRVTNVRKIIGDKLVVDPMGIEMKDFRGARNPVIRLKSGVGRSGVDTSIKQLQLQDVTVNHIKDIETIWGFIQTSSGINDNALGQYSQGRRSAAESRTVNAGAASRLKTIATVLWETLFAPLGHKLLFNSENLSLEEFQRIIGREADQARLDAMKQTINDGAMLEFFDGTAPSEKGYIAQSMQDLLLGLLENPQTAMMLSQEPFRSLVVEIADLRGIRSPERFLPPLQIQPPPALPPNVTQLPTSGNQPQLPAGPNVGGGAVGPP